MRMKLLFGAVGLAVMVLASACQPITREAAMMDGAAVMTEGPVAAQIVLPDGTECDWAGSGATLAFDGVRVNYTCGTTDAGDIVLLGDPVPVDEIHWTVTEGLVTHGSDGFTLASSEEVTFLLATIDTVNGTQCANAGGGATMGFDDKRVNATCGTVDGKDIVLLGPLESIGSGVYLADIGIMSRTDQGFALDSSEMVAVSRIEGGEPLQYLQ